jgi:hypothetical protein
MGRADCAAQTVILQFSKHRARGVGVNSQSFLPLRQIYFFSITVSAGAMRPDAVAILQADLWSFYKPMK